MDATPDKKDTTKLEELSHAQLVQLLRDALDRLKKANERIEILEKGLNGSLTPKLPVPYSVRSEEARKERKKRLDQKNKEKKKPLRSGRIKTEEKIAKAKRHEDVYPVGVDPSTCSLSHVRPIIRIEAGQAFWVAYHIYRAPNGTYGRVQGALGRSEFGLEIILAIAYQVYALGLSFDKAIALQKFFQNLDLKKSQVDAMLHQLSRVWEKEFDSLLKLLTNSIVVHTDETSWSIKSVWAFLSKNSRVILFGVNKDAKTLAMVLDPASYKGVVVSDNAAVYGKFTKAQKCWAHLLRKAIKLTLLDPKNKEYIDFADGAFQIFYDGRSLQKNQSISEDERDAEIVKLEDRVLALCSVREIETEKLDDPTADSFRLLRRELLGLSLREELFTFVSNPAVAPTNNEAERTLRDAATARRVGRTNKTPRGARRQTIVLSVFESIRTQVPTYTLQGVLNEISSWKTLGESCFTRLMKAAGLTPNDESVLDKLFPNKGKPLP
jgi:transposase